MENYQDYKEEDQVSLKKLLSQYLRNWKWFLLSSFLMLLLAFTYLLVTNSIYNTTTTILIKDAREGRGISELNALGGLGLGAGRNDADDELNILKSKTLLSNVIMDLGIYVNQYAKIGLKTVDIYEASPLKVEFKWDETIRSHFYKSIGGIIIDIESDSQFRFRSEKEEIDKIYNYGDLIILEQGELTVNKSNQFKEIKESEEPIKKVFISIHPLDKSALGFQNALSIEPKSKRSSLIDLDLRSSNRIKNEVFLNTLVNEFNQQAIEDKNLVSTNTVNFITERLKLISKELESVESEKVAFKKQNKLTNIQFEGELIVQEISDSKKRIQGAETQLELTNSMINYLSNSERDSELLPANIGIDSPIVNALIKEFNNLILERDRLLTTSTKLNPLVIDLTENIDRRKQSLLESLENQKNTILLSVKDFYKQQNKINSKIASIPDQEKDFRIISRQQGIKENLYVFLLKKREETSISMAITSPIAKVIDSAYSTSEPVSPRSKIIYLAAFLMGLLIPFSCIYLNDLLDTKINDKSDVQNVLKDVSILAEIGRIKKGDSDVLAVNDRSVLGESFRILRTNLNYFLKNKKTEAKASRIFVTSTIKGEGKTFVSFNTVLALADSSKRILVIGADIRNPQLHRYTGDNKNDLGLSEYLYDDKIGYEKIIKSTKFNDHSIDFIISGRIPPNPSELLLNGRFEILLNEVEHLYDYIVVDTAPCLLVTDTLLISETADITMYVIRARHTEKEILNYTQTLQKEGKIKNLTIVLNDVKKNKLGYGYSYGYGEEEKTFFQKLFRRS